MLKPFLFTLSALCLIGPAAQAHEFWIEPEIYLLSPGDEIRARFHVGQQFKGPSYIYIPGQAYRFDETLNGDLRPVEATVGDNPAYQAVHDTDGLLVVAVETNPTSLTYKAWDKFQGFIDHKGFGDVRARHLARGLPESDFTETYMRFAKTLIGVGTAAGYDPGFEMRTEIIALANPYTDDLSGGLPVEVMLDNAPRPGAQVELFEKAPDGTVTITLHTTDVGGVARLPVRAGYSYLADAVVLLEVDPGSADGAVWETLWASLTFAVP